MVANSNRDRMSDFAYRMMTVAFALVDLLNPNAIDQRVATFGIQEGMVIVDYGCGPGRYTLRFAKLVGLQGIVYAVDVQELALQQVEDMLKARGLSNIVTVLASGYQTDIPASSADMVCALDMFFGVQDPVALLAEIHRILKVDGILILDDGHQSRQKTLEKLNRSGKWKIVAQSRDHLRCKPKSR